MINVRWAFNTVDGKMEEHTFKNMGYFTLTFNYDKTVSASIGTTGPYDFYTIHGWVMWGAWGVGGFLQILSARYLRKYYICHMWLHLFFGLGITAATVVMTLLTI